MESWWLFGIVWLIAEVVQVLRKKPMPRRMVAPAIWATIASVLSSVGYAPQGSNYLMVMAISVVLYGTAAAFIYGCREFFGKAPA